MTREEARDIYERALWGYPPGIWEIPEPLERPNWAELVSALGHFFNDDPEVERNSTEWTLRRRERLGVTGPIEYRNRDR